MPMSSGPARTSFVLIGFVIHARVNIRTGVRSIVMEVDDRRRHNQLLSSFIFA